MHGVIQAQQLGVFRLVSLNIVPIRLPLVSSSSEGGGLRLKLQCPASHSLLRGTVVGGAGPVFFPEGAGEMGRVGEAGCQCHVGDGQRCLG